MTEDKLTPEQRIRLEALAQANLTLGAPMKTGPNSPGYVLDVASRYEKFIVNGTVE